MLTDMVWVELAAAAAAAASATATATSDDSCPIAAERCSAANLLHRLRAKTWLDDDVVDAYMSLLERARAPVGGSGTGSGVRFASSWLVKTAAPLA